MDKISMDFDLNRKHQHTYVLWLSLNAEKANCVVLYVSYIWLVELFLRRFTDSVALGQNEKLINK